MADSPIAVDYSRPIATLFSQEPRFGIVHGVFDKAANITFNNTMMSLLSDELPRMPNSLRLHSIAAGKLLPKLRSGMEVYVGNHSLSIPSCNFIFRLSDTPVWEPIPDISTYNWDRLLVARHIHTLAQLLAAKHFKEGLAPLVGSLFLEHPPPGTPISRMALPQLRLLVQASWQQSIAGIEEATRGLAGLGPGLTPSGDDVLGGFAAVMSLLSQRLSTNSISRRYIPSIICSVAKPRTTKLSGILLDHAAKGEVSEPFSTLLQSLMLPVEESRAVLKAADRALTFGASSGGDTLLGILLGLSALAGEIE